MFDYAHQIHEKGYRLTPQRLLILDAIYEGRGHVTFREISHRVRKKSPAVSLPTIYRNLDFLCRLRLVASLQLGNKTYYEIVSTEPHHHLICRRCGRIDQVGADTVSSLFAKIEREQRFQVDTDHMALFGLCESCRSPKGAANSRRLR